MSSSSIISSLYILKYIRALQANKGNPLLLLIANKDTQEYPQIEDNLSSPIPASRLIQISKQSNKLDELAQNQLTFQQLNQFNIKFMAYNIEAPNNTNEGYVSYFICQEIKNVFKHTSQSTLLSAFCQIKDRINKYLQQFTEIDVLNYHSKADLEEYLFVTDVNDIFLNFFLNFKACLAYYLTNLHSFLKLSLKMNNHESFQNALFKKRVQLKILTDYVISLHQKKQQIMKLQSDWLVMTLIEELKDIYSMRQILPSTMKNSLKIAIIVLTIPDHFSFYEKSQQKVLKSAFNQLKQACKNYHRIDQNFHDKDDFFIAIKILKRLHLSRGYSIIQQFATDGENYD